VEARRRHVPPPIVISERGREDTAAALHGSQIQLRPAVQSVSDEPPADQVSAGVCGHAGEVLECGRGEEVVEANTADGRVGVESCNDGITEGHDVNEPRPGPETVRKRAGLPRCRYRRRYSIADCITPRGYSSLSPVEARVEVPYSPAPEPTAATQCYLRRSGLGRFSGPGDRRRPRAGHVRRRDRTSQHHCAIMCHLTLLCEYCVRRSQDLRLWAQSALRLTNSWSKDPILCQISSEGPVHGARSAPVGCGR
jgi:hypothetical protein